ncbi:hypothetical protein OPT61_g6821 [Boeremia exigua]|uniref:Uncharacterized protein n=1 Tax=Boeremia exigua TaxID=749465 RepID=A0ACC2I5S9_9PLEO|nr:hypothetical protein OPT61_g6821 [Boeremia exigua]
MSAHQDDAGDYALKLFAKFERAKRTHSKCLAKELAIRDELKRIERRKIELATMRKMNGGQRNVWMENLVENIIIPYSKAWNRKIADRVRGTLPVEIRSMVYSYLLDDDTWEEFDGPFHAVTSVLPLYIGHCRCMKSHRMPRAPQFLYPEYVGAEAALEIVGKLYSSDWFKEKTVYAPIEHLQTRIHNDPFGAGFDLASCIRSLHVTCLVDRYRTPPKVHLPSEACRHTPYERKYIDRGRLKSEFDQMISVLRNKDFRSLEVTLLQRNVRIDVLEEVLETLIDVHRASRKAKIPMHVEWVYYLDYELDEYGEFTRRNLDKFFTQPRYTWKHRHLQFLKEAEMDPLHVKFMNEPSLGLSDNDFVHRMWDADETFDPTDEEDCCAYSGDEDEDEDENGDSEDSSSSELD